MPKQKDDSQSDKRRLLTNADLNAIGYVREIDIPWGAEQVFSLSCLEICPDYLDAMTNMSLHSHFWILCWLDQADRQFLKEEYPLEEDKKIIPTEIGVFGIRSPARPNPISLTLVKLEKIEGNLLYVSGLDIFAGTPVLDIKPYFYKDILFSPLSPYIKGPKRKNIKERLYKRALRHHEEACSGLAMAVQMAVKAEEVFGNLQHPQLTLKVKGSPCLADTLQGLCLARLANPPRFIYLGEHDIPLCIWRKGNTILQTTCACPELSKASGAEILAMDNALLIHGDKTELV